MAELTARELEVLRLICQGYTTGEIGRQLHLSPDTVRTYLRRVYDAAGLTRGYRNRAALVAWGLRRGLIT